MGWDEWACRGGVGIWVTEVGEGEKIFGCWDCLRKQVWGFRILRKGLCLLLYWSTFHCTNEAHQQLSLETPGMAPNAHIRPPSFRHCPQRPQTNPLPPPQTVPAILSSRISPNTPSTLASNCPCAYISLVSASRNCCTCAIRLYASAQNRNWIFTNASKLGSRYGTRKSISWGSSLKSCSLSAS